MEGFGNGDLVVEDVQVQVPLARDMVLAANAGLKKRNFARKVECATNGVYYLMDENSKRVAVFKPEEEEYHGHEGGSRRWRKGDRAIREFAAYLLDFPKEGEEEGFGSPTTLVQCMGFKPDGGNVWSKGSLQMFVPNKAWHHLGTDNVFSLQDFQKMTLLHIRYGNMGGHKFNILRTKEGRLIPVDHGECFPKSFHQYRYDWTKWKQAAEPYLPEMLAYVDSLNVDKDLEILKDNGIQLEDEVLFIFKVQHLLLKEGVLGGYVPRDIGELMTCTDTRLVNLANIVRDCRSYHAPGDEQQLMENIRVNAKAGLDSVRRDRIERERLMSLKDNKKFEEATSSNVVVPQKIEEPEPKLEKAFTGLIIEREPDTQAPPPLQPPKPVPANFRAWGKRKPKNPPS